jgi:hypothetical protein
VHAMVLPYPISTNGVPCAVKRVYLGMVERLLCR